MIEDALERVLPEMEVCCEKIKHLIDDIEKNRSKLETRKTEVKAAFEKCRQDAEIQLQKIIDRATEDYNALVKELNIKEEEEVNKIRLDRQKEFTQLLEWMNTSTESVKGVTLMHEIQTSLGKRLRELAELKTIARSQERLSLPELILIEGNFSVENNVIGKIQYATVKILKFADCRNPEKPFKDILQGKFQQSKQIKLKG